MIPISDNIPSSSKPIGNYLLIGINMALFLWEPKLEIAGELGDLVNSWCVVPCSDYCSNGKRDHKWKPSCLDSATDAIQFTAIFSTAAVRFGQPDIPVGIWQEH